MSDGKLKYIASSMDAKLPYTLTKGVTATRQGLVFKYTDLADYCAESLPLFKTRLLGEIGHSLLLEWPDAVKRLRYREGEPWCSPVVNGVISLSPASHPTGGRETLHRLAAILCDDAEAFWVLHWCVTNLGGQG